MPYQPISDFRGGLDARKMFLALPAGTLTQCVNAHINQGAEIEKRKAFVLNTIPYESTFPTFGCCGGVTGTGIYIFGSGSLSGGTAPNSVTPGVYPSPMIYQMITHPAVSAGLAYVSGTHNLVAVICSELWGSFPFVVCKFADGGIFPYYNGVLLQDFTAGVVMAYMVGTNSYIASALATLANNSSLYNGLAIGTALELFSQPGSSFNAAITISSQSGFIVSTTGNLNYPTATVAYNNGSVATPSNTPDGTTIQLGGQVYRFKNVMQAAFDVQIGQTYVQTTQNLFYAINLSGTAGSTGSGANYYTGTVKNANVYASSLIQSPNPTFTMTATALNQDGENANNILGVTLVEEAATVLKSQGAQAQGQFQVVAGPSLNFIEPNASGVLYGPVTGSGTTLNVQPGSMIYVSKIINGNFYNGYYFVFQSDLTTVTLDCAVQIGSSLALTLQNLQYAINGTGTLGVNYKYQGGGNVNSNISASGATGSNFIITLTSLSFPGNNIVVYPDYYHDSATTNLTFKPTGGTPFSGSSGYVFLGGVVGINSITINAIAATGTIASNGSLPASGSTLVVAGTSYNLVSSLPSTPVEGNILIGLTANDTLQNIIEAINQTGVYGVNYQVSSMNPKVSALPSLQSGIIRVIARTAGSAGSSLQITTTDGTYTVSPTLQGGADTTNLIQISVPWLNGQTLQQFCNSVSAAITSYQGTSGFYAVNKSNTIYIYASTFDSYPNSAVISVTAIGVACGFLGLNFAFAQTISGAITGAGFNIGAGGLQINGTQLLSSESGAPPFVIGGTVLTLSQLVASIAANINSNTANGVNTTWMAVPNGTALYLSNIVTTSNDAPQTITYGTDSVGIGSSSVLEVGSIGNASLSAIVTPDYIGFTRINNVTANYSPIVATCTAAGGYPPYIYNWQYVSGDTGFYVTDSTKQNVTFGRQDNNGSDTAFWSCSVTDSQGNSSTSNSVEIYQP